MLGESVNIIDFGRADDIYFIPTRVIVVPTIGGGRVDNEDGNWRVILTLMTGHYISSNAHTTILFSTRDQQGLAS